MELNNEAVPNGTSPPSFATGGWRSHKILIILFLIYLSDYADRMVVSSMIDFIKRDWGISDAQAGWLISVVVLFITVFTIPAAMLIDRWSRRKMVAIMTFLWSVATLSCAFTKNYTQLLMARAFIGIGEAGYAPGGSAMLAGAYAEESRAKVMGIWNASIPMGVGIGLAAGGIIAKNWGWHHAFGLVALPGFILAIAAWSMPDYKTVKPEESATGLGEADHPLKKFVAQSFQILKIPSLLFTYFGFAMAVSATTALMTWLPTYFERIGFAEQGRGGALSSIIFALVLVGAPLGGVISDIWHRRRKRGRVIYCAISQFLSSVLLLGSILVIHDRTLSLGFLVVYGVVVSSFIAPAASVTQDVVHPGLRAFSYGMCVILQHLLGDIWSSPLVGFLSDKMGIEKAIMFVPVYGVLACVCFIVASLYYENDLGRVEKVELVME